MRGYFLTVATATCLFLARPGFSTTEKVKIGLVLSGGAARGIAHIGVLKVLEELRIPIDCVAGTSMGAIIGGLWASGLTSFEIEQIVLQADWERIFKDRPPRKVLSLRQKQLAQVYPTDFELGYKKGRFYLPRGLIAGQQLIFLLRRLTLPVSQIEDFDRLPIPFRAVATDIVTGKPVVLKSGSLTETMRASMSIPGIFAPVEKGEYLLVDGGIVDNLPVDICREMGAELIIAVDVTSSLQPREKLTSLLAVSSQVIDLMTVLNVEKQIATLDKEKDVLIRPALPGISSLAFSRAKELIALGEKAAREMTESLVRHQVSPEEYAAYTVRCRTVKSREIIPQFVEIEGTGRLSPEMVKRNLTVRPGESLDLNQLQGDINRIYDLGEFELVDFRVEEKNHQEGLVLHMKSKAWGPNYLRFGLYLYDDFGEKNYYGLLVNYTWSQLNRFGAYWENQFGLGKNLVYATEVFLPAGAYRHTFLAPRLELRQSISDIYAGNQALCEHRVTWLRAGLDIGGQLGQYGEVRAGIEKGMVES
ncbi:MAG: patatin-like phospholipase family protein, partial [Candidatus Omnitrophica bacterium]|nr:patatin-like phospholipase family protein [Candidatus Omnitrophota bacterium]